MADKVYRYILDFKGKTDQIQKDVGGVKGLLKGAALAAGALFTVDKVMDAARAVADYAKQIDSVRVASEKLTGLNGSALDKLTGGVSALSKVYETEMGETLGATNALMKAFGENGTAAFNAINSGLSGSANANKDFLKQVSEYSIHFKEAGLSASEMVAVIAESNKMGVFDDKGADAIKEGTIRLREMAQGTRDAINAIGLSSTTIQQEISSGNMSMFEVMQLVSKQLKTLPEQSPAVGQALADIFGGPGEDAVQFIRNLTDINTDLAKVNEASGGAADAQRRYTESLKEFDTLGAQVFGGTNDLITSVKATMMEWLNASIRGTVNLINYFIDLYNESMAFRAAIEYVTVIFKNIWDVTKLVFGNIVNYLQGAGKLIKAVFTGDFGAIAGIINDTYSSIADTTILFGQNVAENFKQGYENVMNPRAKVEMISLSSQQAEAAGVEAGKSYAKGVAEGTVENNRRGENILPTMKPLSSGLLPNSYNVQLVEKNKEVEESNKDLSQSYEDLRNNVVNALNSMGQIFGEKAAGWMNFAGVIIQQTPILIANIAALAAAHRAASITSIVASEGETMASTASGAAKLPFPANLIAIGASIAAVAAMFAAIPRAEFGGIVPGNSFTGDKKMIRVNSNEEVLRRDDPRHAYNLRGGRQGGGSIINILQDGITIDGNKLRILLKKEERRVALRAVTV